MTHTDGNEENGMARAENARGSASEAPSATYSVVAAQWITIKNRFEDALCEAGFGDFVDSWTDPYDDSIEFSAVRADARLTPEQQRLVYDGGFIRCWTNHVDGWETYYVWPVPFSPVEGHRCLRTKADAAVAGPPNAEDVSTNPNSVRAELAELVEACKRLRSIINDHVSLADVDAFDAAIAKAEGSPTSERDGYAAGYAAAKEEAAKVAELWATLKDKLNVNDAELALAGAGDLAEQIRALKADSPTCERTHIAHITET